MTRGAIAAKPCFSPRSRELQREIGASGQAAVNDSLTKERDPSHIRCVLSVCSLTHRIVEVEAAADSWIADA